MVRPQVSVSGTQAFSHSRCSTYTPASLATMIRSVRAVAMGPLNRPGSNSSCAATSVPAAGQSFELGMACSAGPACTSMHITYRAQESDACSFFNNTRCKRWVSDRLCCSPPPHTHTLIHPADHHGVPHDDAGSGCTGYNRLRC
jgi:hypothetical protein